MLRHLILISFVLLSLLVSASAQSSSASTGWTRSAGGSGDDFSRSLAIDGTGSIYVVGHFRDTMDVSGATLTSLGVSDIFVVKYRPDGSVEWRKRIGGSGAEFSISIVADVTGDLYITGRFQGTVDFDGVTLSSVGSSGIFVARYRPDGTIVSAIRVRISPVECEDIQVDGEGNIYITGRFAATADFDGIEIRSRASNIQNDAFDIFIARYHPDGTIAWVRTPGAPNYGTPTDKGNALAVDASGNVYVTGIFYGSGDFDGIKLASRNGVLTDVFVVKYDSDGTIQWVRRAGGTGNDGGNDIAVDASGNVYVTGSFQNTADFGSDTVATVGGSGQYNDLFLAKYHSDGILEWVRTAGGSRGDGGSDITVDASGNIYVAGHFQQTATFDDYEITSTGGDDVFVARYRQDGSVAWVHRGGGNRYDVLAAIDATGSGTVYLLGTFETTAEFGGTVLTSAGGIDNFLWKLDGSNVESTVAVETGVPIVKSVGVSGITIQPNPVSEQAQILFQTAKSGHTRVVVIDMLGRVVAAVYDGELSSGYHALPLNTAVLPAGAYHVLFVTSAVRSTYRMDIIR